MTQPDISIIIVSYNVRDELSRCLRSLLAARGGMCREIIVIDNASTDGTSELLDPLEREDDRLRVVRNPGNLGFAAACNQGSEIAAGRYLLFLNPDTIVPEGALESLARHLDDHPGIGAIGPRIEYPDGSLQLTCGERLQLRHSVFDSFRLWLLSRRLFGGGRYMNWDHDRPRQVDWVSGGCLMIGNEFFHRLGRFDENYFIYAEDMDLCLRIVRDGRRVLYWPAVCVVHAEGRSSKKERTASLLHRYRSRLYYFRKHRGRVISLLHRAVYSAASWVECAVVAVLWMVRRDPEYRRILTAHLHAGLRVWFVRLPAPHESRQDSCSGPEGTTTQKH